MNGHGHLSVQVLVLGLGYGGSRGHKRNNVTFKYRWRAELNSSDKISDGMLGMMMMGMSNKHMKAERRPA